MYRHKEQTKDLTDNDKRKKMKNVLEKLCKEKSMTFIHVLEYVCVTFLLRENVGKSYKEPHFCLQLIPPLLSRFHLLLGSKKG